MRAGGRESTAAILDGAAGASTAGSTRDCHAIACAGPDVVPAAQGRRPGAPARHCYPWRCPTVSYTVQRSIAIGVAVALVILGAIQVADPSSLGINPIVARWLGILAAGLGTLAGFLPSVQGRGKDPSYLTDRVWELEPEDRARVARDLTERALAEDRASRAGERMSPDHLSSG